MLDDCGRCIPGWSGDLCAFIVRPCIKRKNAMKLFYIQFTKKSRECWAQNASWTYMRNYSSDRLRATRTWNGEVSPRVYFATKWHILALGSLLTKFLLSSGRCKNRLLFPLRLFKSFPWDIDNLPTRHIHNWFSFMFYFNIKIGSFNYACRRGKISVCHYLI